MDSIKFKVNGVECSVGNNVSSDVMLVDYLRNYLELRGTKYMCREGGCGACIVTASKSPGTPQQAVNSCLVSIGSCDGWDIRTIEGMGNKKDGYHALQKSMAHNHAVQCGYCSPGWIMAMHGVMESKKDLTMLEIEESFGSNICRCTGYRPILTSLKQFAKDAPKEEQIKDVGVPVCCKKSGSCNKSGNAEDEWCMVLKDDLQLDEPKKIVLKDGKMWYQAKKLVDVFDILTNETTESYMLVAGNTAKGAVPLEEYPRVMIDISKLKELKTVKYDQNLIAGAGLTLTEFLEVLEAASKTENFRYLARLHKHISLVAHIPVRNIGTIAGNLMIKHKNEKYPSDIYLVLKTVGAELSIMSICGQRETVTMEDFLDLDMNGKIILNVMLPPLSDDSYRIYTYKLMPRAQSAHAIVNAGFLYKLNSSDVVEEARIVYEHLSPQFTRARATEGYLIGKPLFTNKTLLAAMRVLDGEIIVEENPLEPSAKYREFIAKSLFFKGLLTLCPPHLRGARYDSGTINLHEVRPVSKSKQGYATDYTKWPFGEPVKKVEALAQTSGEAKFTEDMPSIPNEVFAAFVLSTVGQGTILQQDASEALKYPGVIAYYTAKDIPGLNSFTPADSFLYRANEEVLCDGKVKFYHQPVGIIVAETQNIANRATSLVKVKYGNVKKPVCDIKKAKKDAKRNTTFAEIAAKSTGRNTFKTITGSNSFQGQYHFTMETMTCVVVPTEDGLEVHSTTQWLDGVHVMISRALNLEAHKIECHVRRIGGGYGFKISRPGQSAVACSLVAHKLNRPCRLIQPLTTNMRAIGKRMPCVNDYEVGVNSVGEIQYLNSELYSDHGYMGNEIMSALTLDVYENCYDVNKINYKAIETCTDTAKNTFCRSPGTLEAIASMECIIERISYELSLDPLAVRLVNLDKTKYNALAELLDGFKIDADYTARRAAVNSFNTNNRWKKRGLRWSFARWFPAGALRLNLQMSIFHSDGSVVITHAGVEMGQGLNTKTIQVAAHLLNIPIEKIKIKPNNTTTVPNSFLSGGSLTTQNVIISLKRCCDEVNKRLEPIRAKLTNPTWEELIKTAYNDDVSLQAQGFVGLNDGVTYEVYGMALCEVEVDVLTGEYEVLRVDMTQDVGQSINPDIDIGQVEGGFMMGLGYWTCEKLVYDDSGAILTDRTWDYHVPQGRDIPENFRVHLMENSSSSEKIMGSKGTGEAASCASIVVAFAIREAIVEARKESKIPTTEWFPIDGPCSTENVCMAMKTKPLDFKFK